MYAPPPSKPVIMVEHSNRMAVKYTILIFRANIKIWCFV